MRIVRLLIAGDHAGYREAVLRCLASEGCGCEGAGDRRILVVGMAGDGAQALAICRELRPDVLVTDVGISALDGLDLTMRVRRELPETAVVALYPSGCGLYAEAAQLAGAHASVAMEQIADALVPTVLAIA